jgi:hypothetical protein
MNLGRLWCRPPPWTTLLKLVKFVVDKVVQDDRCMLFANELESITLPDWSTRAIGPGARDAFPIFQDVCLLGSGERFLSS